MSIKVMTWAWEKDLPPPMKLVLLKLADRSNDEGECWPGQGNMARECSMSERSVMRHIDALSKAGYLTKTTRRGENGQRMTNVYQLRINVQQGDNLSHGQCDNHGKNHVTTVSPILNDELPVLTISSEIDESCNQLQVVPDPVQYLGDRFSIDDAVFDTWIRIYQRGRRIDETEDWIEAELAKAVLWLQANPKRKKKRWLAFLNGWLDRAGTPRRPLNRNASASNHVH